MSTVSTYINESAFKLFLFIHSVVCVTVGVRCSATTATTTREQRQLLTNPRLHIGGGQFDLVPGFLHPTSGWLARGKGGAASARVVNGETGLLQYRVLKRSTDDGLVRRRNYNHRLGAGVL